MEKNRWPIANPLTARQKMSHVEIPHIARLTPDFTQLLDSHENEEKLRFPILDMVGLPYYHQQALAYNIKTKAFETYNKALEIWCQSQLNNSNDNFNSLNTDEKCQELYRFIKIVFFIAVFSDLLAKASQFNDKNKLLLDLNNWNEILQNYGLKIDDLLELRNVRYLTDAVSNYKTWVSSTYYGYTEFYEYNYHTMRKLYLRYCKISKIVNDRPMEKYNKEDLVEDCLFLSSPELK